MKESEKMLDLAIRWEQAANHPDRPEHERVQLLAKSGQCLEKARVAEEEGK